MRTLNKILAIALAVVFLSCDNYLQDINTNPNDLTEINNEYLFAYSVQLTLREDLNGLLNAMFGGQYAHIYVSQSNRYIDAYYDNFTNTKYSYVFSDFYEDPLKHIQEVIRLTQPGGEQENTLQCAMAKTVAIYNFSKLVDAFGAVPYSEGGIGGQNVLYPKYDEASTIYFEMLEQLGEIVPVLASGDASDGYAKADPLFDNDLEKWQRFANSLRFRLAMRIRFVEPDLAGTIITECMANPLIESNDDNAMKQYEESSDYELQSPLFRSFNMWDWRMSEKFVDFLKETDDPRLYTFVKPYEGELPADDSLFVGVPNGLTEIALANRDWSKASEPGDKLVGCDAVRYILTASEVWLLRAEAALDGLIVGDPNEFYQKGVQLSFEQWDISQTEIEQFFNQSIQASLSGTTEEQFALINTQLWVALMPNAFECWTNIRRSGYPKIPQRLGSDLDKGVSDGKLPRRLKYPSSEINLNNANYEDAVGKQGADEITTPLWWDVKD